MPKDDEDYLEIDPAEQGEVTEICGRIRTLKDMTSILGEPDEIAEIPIPPALKERMAQWQHAYTGDYPVRLRSYQFFKRWKTIHLYIMEQYDGTVTMGWHGKPKPDSSAAAAFAGQFESKHHHEPDDIHKFLRASLSAKKNILITGEIRTAARTAQFITRMLGGNEIVIGPDTQDLADSVRSAKGAIFTLESEGLEDALEQLCALASRTKVPIGAARKLIAASIQLVVLVGRSRGVFEIVGLHRQTVITRKLFENPSTPTGDLPTFFNELGISDTVFKWKRIAESRGS